MTATSSNHPVFSIKDKDLNNKTFIGIGSFKPDMQELPLNIYKKAEKVYGIVRISARFFERDVESNNP